MGPQKKQDTNSPKDHKELDKIHKDIQKLTKITTKLQANYKKLSKALKEIDNSVKNLTKTVQNNKEAIDTISSSSDTTKSDNLVPISESKHGERVKIDREHFIPALNGILLDLKKMGKKGFVDIKTVKNEFLNRYYLEQDTNFEIWLLESYWSNEIELISGIGDYSVRDIYDNVYHHIRY